MTTKIRTFLFSSLLPLVLINPQPEGFPLAGPLVAEPQAQDTTFIPFRKYSREEDEKIVKLYEGLRVADVSDGMDIVGLQDVGLMDPEIKPLWRDLEDFHHRICGLAAQCAMFQPTSGPER